MSNTNNCTRGEEYAILRIIRQCHSSLKAGVICRSVVALFFNKLDYNPFLYTDPLHTIHTYNSMRENVAKWDKNC